MTRFKICYDTHIQNFLKKALKLTIGAVIVIGIIIAIVFVSTSGAVDVVNQQIELIQMQKLEEAYALTNPEFQRITNFEDFKAFVEEANYLRDVADTSFSSREINKNLDSTTSEISGEFTMKDESKVPIYYALEKDDDWKIVGITFGN